MKAGRSGAAEDPDKVLAAMVRTAREPDLDDRGLGLRGMAWTRGRNAPAEQRALAEVTTRAEARELGGHARVLLVGKQ